MLCSGAELGLSEESDGILELSPEAPNGKLYAIWAGLDDPMIEINLLPNRPDAMAIYGIARDLAAAGLGRLKPIEIPAVKANRPFDLEMRSELAPEDSHLAPVFAARLVRGVKNGPSPDWLQKRLKSIGLRPINALADITNFLTFDRARPLHVFDAGKISGALIVRRARAEESLQALDQKTYTLNSENVVIADNTGVLSIAGIMGGLKSGCTADTTDVLIESALWDPVNIARSGRRLGINSDARYRFERGIDPAFTLPGLDHATNLVLSICGGAASEVKMLGKVPEPDKHVIFPWSEVKRLTGLELETSEMANILENLGFELAGVATNSDMVHVKVPSFRPDIGGKADIVEEIVRIVGLDRLKPVPLPRDTAHISSPVLTLLQKRTRTAKRALAAAGMVEAITWSFISAERAKLFGGGKPELKLVNPIAADLSDMRPSLLPGLLAAAVRNTNRGFADLALFEVGQIFWGDKPEDQKMAASGLRRAKAKPQGHGRHWSQPGDHYVDVFDAKADALSLLNALGVSTGGLQLASPGPDWLHPGRSGFFQFGPKNVIGAFGEIHPALLELFDLAGPVVAFELILNEIPAPKARPSKAKPKLELSEFMPLQRDFAFLCEESVKAQDLIRAVQGAERNLLTSVDIFDVYQGKGVPEGHKSVAISVQLQPRDKTLTETEIDSIAAKIITEVNKKTGATLRG
jgi:phenylalanyl-tRNA synthetase beta chain